MKTVLLIIGMSLVIYFSYLAFLIIQILRMKGRDEEKGGI